jgi:hypothetical protein
LYLAGIAPAALLNGGANVIGLTYQEIKCTVDWARQASAVDSKFPSPGVFKPLGIGTEGAGLLMSSGSPGFSSQRSNYGKHGGSKLALDALRKKYGKPLSATDPVAGKAAVAVKVDVNAPCEPENVKDELLKALLGGPKANVELTVGSSSKPITLHLGDTQPYYKQVIKTEGLRRGYRIEKGKVWGDLVLEGVRANAFRLPVSHHMRQSRKGREALDNAIDKAREYLDRHGLKAPSFDAAFSDEVFKAWGQTS